MEKQRVCAFDNKVCRHVGGKSSNFLYFQVSVICEGRMGTTSTRGIGNRGTSVSCYPRTTSFKTFSWILRYSDKQDISVHKAGKSAFLHCFTMISRALWNAGIA